jgi:hypothetical protein
MSSERMRPASSEEFASGFASLKPPFCSLESQPQAVSFKKKTTGRAASIFACQLSTLNYELFNFELPRLLLTKL